MDILKVFLSHTISKLILIRSERGTKGGKTLPYNTTIFPKFELEITGQVRRNLNHITYMSILL